MKLWKAAAGLSGLAALGAGAAAWVYYHPEILIGQIQKRIYKGKPINSFEPLGTPMRHIKENGQLYVTEICYGKDYANSYLDITYPTADTGVDRPTVVYFHGGGFFGGDKSMGDPLAVGDSANLLFEEIAANGFNFVNVNYALVPDYHFPVPVIQMVQAIDYLADHAQEYGLNMENVIVFGQSAGAGLAVQYGALLSSKVYRDNLNIHPRISPDAIKALVIDDTPVLDSKGNWATRMMAGCYHGTMHMTSERKKKINAFLHLNQDYPPSFLTAGNTDGFPEDMKAFSDRLQELGVEQEYYFTPKEKAELPHGYLSMVHENPYARECFDHILDFMKRYAGNWAEENT